MFLMFNEERVEQLLVAQDLVIQLGLVLFFLHY